MLLKQKQKMFDLLNRLRAIPKRYTISLGLLLFLIIIYIATYLIEKPIQFSYAGESCVKRMTLLPDLHVSSNEDGYELRPANAFKVGTWSIASRGVCVTPTTAPVVGTVKASLSPFGGVFAKQTFAISTESPVRVDTKVLERPVPVSRPLHLRLSGVDTTFSYALRIAEKQAVCQAKDTTLLCAIDTLGLEQSKSYTASLVRQFKGKEVATVATKHFQTLSATAVVDSSVKPGAVVYDKPSEITLKVDKALTSGEVELNKIEGDQRIVTPVTMAAVGTDVTVKLQADLARASSYELVLKNVEATDGSGLVEPYKLTFTVSGGPRSTGVDIGTTGVAAGTTAVITFDQPLSDHQDVNKFVTLTGGATLAGKRGNQLLISTSNVPRCGDFTINITNDLQSNYGISGHSAWSFASRTNCYTTSTIGTSSQGRPITAYYFGTGATSVLYTGAIHGSEMSTKALMDRWVQDLDAKARTIPAHMSVVVVPALNPDGIARGSRVNANNVDLNRNFATNDWQKDITTVGNQPFPGGGGESAMSEPEVRAIGSLAQRLRPKLILSYHSIGSMVAANQAGNSSAFAATYAQLSGYRNITGQSDTTFEYSVTGTADDWYAQSIGVPSLLVELGSHSYHQFERNQAAMWAMINS